MANDVVLINRRAVGDKSRNLEVRKCRGLGRGVFTTKAIKAGSLIESCHVILLPIKSGAANPTVEYSFRWNKNKVAIVLGNGSLYNHSYEPNAYVIKSKQNLMVGIYALKPIKAGEQIFINYNGDFSCKDDLWFNVK